MKDYHIYQTWLRDENFSGSVFFIFGQKSRGTGSGSGFENFGNTPKNSERKIPTSRRSRSEIENPKKTPSGKSRKSRNPGDEDRDRDISTKSHPLAPILLTLGTNNELVKEFLTRFAGFSYFIKSQEIKTQVSVNYI